MTMAPACEGCTPARLATPSGMLVGEVDVAAGVRVFRGIRYAEAPVGPLRWRPPVPVAPWRGERDARVFGNDCPQSAQKPSRAPAQSEDCLFLNVWAPLEPAATRLPVMVWLHGGSFVGGSGADARCDGAALARRGVVLVTLNYRVGLFGFLAHPALSAESEEGISGNYGLLDQLCALRWVRDHIGAFGGDASNVTLFGVSAGSASASLLLTSPLARGLFHKTILQSPGAARPLASLRDAAQAGAQLGEDIAALRALDAATLLGKTSVLVPRTRGLTTPRMLRPIRDGWVLCEDERPAFQAGRLHAMPLLVGSNSDEGSSLTATWPLQSVADYEAVVQRDFGDAVEKVHALYPAPADAMARPRVAEMFADTQFNYGARLLAQSMARMGQPTWRYVFTRRRPGQVDGPHHGDEVRHVMGTLATLEPAAHDAVDAALSDCIGAAWVAFAAHGDPQVTGGPRWPAYDVASDPYLELAGAPQPGQGWRRAQLEFLEHLYAQRAARGTEKQSCATHPVPH